MDSELFSAPYDTDPNWTIAKSFFRELVLTTRQKVRWPGDEGGGVGLGKEDREGFDSWRRDAGEVIVGAYVLQSLAYSPSQQRIWADWQILHPERRDVGRFDKISGGAGTG